MYEVKNCHLDVSVEWLQMLFRKNQTKMNN